MSLQWPEVAKPVPSSKVILACQDWREEAILVPHECIRWWNRELLKVLDEYDVTRPSCAWKTPLLFKFLESYYLPCIHHHHDAEEKIYNPHILAFCESKGMANPFRTMKNDHEKLMAQLDKLASFKSGLEKQDAKALRDFKQAFTTMVQFMEEHLADEERTYPAILKESGMTQEDEQAGVDKILQGLGLDGNKRLLPPIMYAMCMWKGKEKMMEWYAKVPPPIRFLCDNCWLDDFYQNQLRVLEGLQKEEEFQAQSPSCNCSLM